MLFIFQSFSFAIHVSIFMHKSSPIFFSIKSIRWQSRRTCTQLLRELQNNNYKFVAKQASPGECWITPKKVMPHPRAKEKPQQEGRKGEIAFRIKPHTQQRCLEGSNKTLCAPGDPTETELDLPLSVWVSPEEVWVCSALPQGQGLWMQQTLVWHKPSWRRSPLTPPQSHQNLHRTAETESWRAQTKPCAHQDPGEESSDPRTDWPRLACECPGVSGRSRGLLQGQRQCVQQCLHGTFIFITSTIVWPQVKQQGGNTAPKSTEKLEQRFTEHGPAHQNKTQFPPQSVSPIRKLP